MTGRDPMPAPAAEVGPHRALRHGDTAALVGESPAIEALRRAMRAVAPTRSTVLVTGETGTGKGLVARLLHELSRPPDGSRDGPFVHVDCASLSPTVIESELFGHERGAFTGAVERCIGRFERAGHGTVFLDEIADVEPGLQAKLLRVLQDRVFERVGGGESLALRARVVAATNRDLDAEIRAGGFRADLYYRLQVVELRLPPLRERPDDLPLLLRAFVEGLYQGRPGARPAIADDLAKRLAAHPWPGNVRELRNVVERLSVLRPRGPWRARDLDGMLARRPDVAPPPVSRAAFERRERAELERVLVAHRWNVSAAARSLGISRGALRGRLARLGLR